MEIVPREDRHTKEKLLKIKFISFCGPHNETAKRYYEGSCVNSSEFEQFKWKKKKKRFSFFFPAEWLTKTHRCSLHKDTNYRWAWVSFWVPNPDQVNTPACGESLLSVAFYEEGVGQLCVSLPLSFTQELLSTMITSVWNLVDIGYVW